MKLLVIEDEIKLARALQRGLITQKHTVDVVHDGLEGLDLASTQDYDVIIMDIMLPSLSGIEICQQIRQDKNITPILMLTAKGQIQDRVLGLDAGADDYLVKPFSFEELFSRIRALSRRHTRTTETNLKVGDLTLDPVRISVTRAQVSITLSAKEFALLEFLMRHPGKTFSKEQLVNQIWNYDADILPSTVEVHIKNLRDKIDKPFPKPLLKTLRGFGYQISET